MDSEAGCGAWIAELMRALEALDPADRTALAALAADWAQVRPPEPPGRLAAAIEHADLALAAAVAGPGGVSRAIDALLRVHQLLVQRQRP